MSDDVIIMDTDKFHAICDALSIPPTRDPDAALRAALAQKAALNERNIEFERIKLNVKRLALGVLGVVGLTYDDLHAWVMKREKREEPEA